MRKLIKSLFRLMEKVIGLFHVYFFIGSIITNSYYFINLLKIISFCCVVIYLLELLLNINDEKSLFEAFAHNSLCLLCVFLLFLYLPRKAVNYDLNTEIGQLQQEILDNYNIATYYDHDITNKFLGLSHDKNNPVTEDEALKSLKKINKVLSFYNGNYPSEIFLVNDFKVKDQRMSGLFINIGNFIILDNNNYIVYNLHHEMGHCIEDKTLDIETLYRFKKADDSCNMISSYACTSGEEMFAEAWRYAIYDGATTPQSLELSDVFRKNTIYFDNPNYVEISDINENLNDLFNNKIDSFIVKKSNGISLSKILINNKIANQLNRLELDDEILFYNMKWSQE